MNSSHNITIGKKKSKAPIINRHISSNSSLNDLVEASQNNTGVFKNAAIRDMQDDSARRLTETD